MKRYRLLAVSFDTRVVVLKTEIEPEWGEDVRKLWSENRQKVKESIEQMHGAFDLERKLKDFADLDREPFSVIAFHNEFLRQCRFAFVAGSYYPALIGACALGERILNHMILRLRDYYKHCPSYKRVYDKESFDNWDLAIGALEEWGVFVKIDDIAREGLNLDRYGDEVAYLFRELCGVRNNSIHFRIDLDAETREPALKAIHLLQEIVDKQFGMRGWLPWFIRGGSGAFYIKKSFEDNPFVREFYLPACAYVGPYHRAIPLRNGSWQVEDPGPYPDRDVTDEEFVQLIDAAKHQG
jgi:hypothetical protein